MPPLFSASILSRLIRLQRCHIDREAALHIGLQQPLTIEVRPDSKRIVQAGAKHTARPTLRVAEIMHHWADQEGLVLPSAQE